MTYYHLINCLMLTYGPYVVVDRVSRLKDESRYGIYAWCLVTYLATQLSKMLVAATFIPPTPPSTAGASGLPPFVALATGFLDLADAAGILYLLSYRCKLGGKEENVLAVGVGWGLAQAVAAHFLPLWMHARATEFTWVSIHRGVEANLQLVAALALTAVVWLHSRGKSSPVSMAVVAIKAIQPLVVALVAEQGAVTVLGAKAALVAASALLAYIAFNYNLVGRSAKVPGSS